MQTLYGILFIIIFGYLASRCERNENHNYPVEITDIELTSREKEDLKDSIIISEINEFLKKNKSASVKNYLALCDTTYIESIRDYDVHHKRSNITIGIGKKDVRLSPIPSVYRIDEGPKAIYKISNDSLGEFASYFLDVELDENYKVKTFKATLRFQKLKGNVKRISFTKEISSSEDYLILEKLRNNKW